jgi:hypothetical protein
MCGDGVFGVCGAAGSAGGEKGMILRSAFFIATPPDEGAIQTTQILCMVCFGHARVNRPERLRTFPGECPVHQAPELLAGLPLAIGPWANEECARGLGT